ncbi:Ig-like domain-containing protein [uncultured Paraglaciecola sp.]|jgi:hypothetical protein|uniref:Ig-like domain-containing protein n=1 Tax=uncultured Paraglaciecola sp. TaxID=1765024 RepID=UPI0025E16358|nr:Ig-like domain-containing protein [uncultured Paraglaciecola sp.]
MCIRALFFVPFLSLVGLSGCGGVSGQNGSDPFGSGPTTESYTITLAILDQQCGVQPESSFTAGETLCIQATLKQGENLVTGEIVSFSSELGSLSAVTKLTNSNGIAQITIDSDVGDVGAATLEASFGDVTSQSNYEFLAAQVVVLPLLRIDLSILNNGVVVNRFKANEQVQIQAVINDENAQPIENIIVNFSVGRGSLNTSDALTDSSGTAQVTLIPTDLDIGAAVVSALTLVNGEELLASLNFEIQSPDAISEQVIRIGHFNVDGVFVENELGISASDSQGNVEISAGATLGVSLAIVDENDQRILTQTPVTFTSSCAEENSATIDQQVNTVNGEAFATYEDISCAGGDGNDDVIVASLVVNNSTLSITRSISILAESVGSITFVSADPTQLVLLGTGGQNNQIISTLIFQVNGALGNPLAQQSVAFSLNTETGGLSLSPAVGITNSQGQVSTRVTSGNVPTPVRVTAEVVTNSSVSILTQSDLLSVNTGLPDQNSFTLSADNLNPEANTISGQTVNFIARLADTFNNPVPDGTSVSFTTEGGVIEPSCVTTMGTCSVTWTSANPRTLDHRITILATAIGHETLFDANGNNSFDDSDGIAIIDNTDSGFGTSQFGQTGFVDHSEAWRDDNANNVKDASEIFLDYNSNGQFDAADGLFNGPQCNSTLTCGQGSAKTLHVRRTLEIVASSSEAFLDILNQADEVIFSNHQVASQPSLVLERGEAVSLSLQFSDTALQAISSNSTISITSSAGLIAGQTSTTMRKTNASGSSVLEFTLTNNLDETTGFATTATIIAEVVSPSGVISVVTFVVALN